MWSEGQSTSQYDPAEENKAHKEKKLRDERIEKNGDLRREIISERLKVLETDLNKIKSLYSSGEEHLSHMQKVIGSNPIKGSNNVMTNTELLRKISLQLKEWSITVPNEEGNIIFPMKELADKIDLHLYRDKEKKFLDDSRRF